MIKIFTASNKHTVYGNNICIYTLYKCKGKSRLNNDRLFITFDTKYLMNNCVILKRKEI